jgi:ABC-type antimicrobial peptide transport system permease subunit
MTVLGIGAAVTVVLTVAGLQAGIAAVNTRTGEPAQVLALRRGPPSETASSIDGDLVARLGTLAHLARDPEDRPLFSAEIVASVQLPRRGGGGNSNAAVRGLEERGIALRPQFEMVEGRLFRPGLGEVVVARSIAGRFAGLEVGDTFRIGNTPLQVVGHFRSGGTAWDSEVWGDYETIRQAFHRRDASSILLEAESPDDVPGLLERIETVSAGSLNAQPLAGYFSKQSESAAMIFAFSQFLALLLALGATFAAGNTMYAAVAQRTSEIGVLRSLGYRPGSILGAFLAESALLGLLGGAVGFLAAFGLSLTGFETGATNWFTFSEQAFGILLTPGHLVVGLVFGLLVGAAGGLFPAIQAARKPVLDALRTL